MSNIGIEKCKIFQGGMGINLSLSALASEVTNCGGAGTLTAVGLGINEKIKTKEEYYANNIDVLTQEVKTTKELTKNGFFGVNIMWVAPDKEILIHTACKNGAKFIVSGAGLPLELPKYVANYPKVAIIPIISTFDGARIISTYWKKNISVYLMPSLSKIPILPVVISVPSLKKLVIQNIIQKM